MSIWWVVALAMGLGALLVGITHRPELPAPARPRTPPTTARFEFSVPTGTLRLDSTDIRGARGALEDLLRLDSYVQSRMEHLARLGGQLTLRRGELAVSWTGPLEQRPAVAEIAQALHDRFVMLEDSAPQIAELLASPRLADRQRLAELADRSEGPSRPRVLQALMRDPDHDLAWQVTSAHGTRENWLDMALSPHRPPDLRGLALSHLGECSPEQRCELVTQLLPSPMLHLAACALLDGLEGERAEIAWLELLECAEDRRVTERAVARLGEVGTLHSLPVLLLLRDRAGLLRFHVRQLLETAIRQIRDRAGAVPGALSLSSGTPSSGALSVPRSRR